MRDRWPHPPDDWPDRHGPERAAAPPAGGQPVGAIQPPASRDDAEAIPLTIVSRSRLLREGLATLLCASDRARLVGLYADDPDAVTSAANPTGHVVLLDSGMGKDAALHWTRFWRGLTPPAHVVVLELIDDVDVILACIEAGAAGYTLQGASVAEVAETIARVQQGIAQCSPQVTARLFQRVAAAGAAPPAVAGSESPLTARELEVLRCIAGDLSNDQIAAKLVLQLSTVKHHVHHILDKLEVRHRWDAVRVALDRGWLDRDADVGDSISA
jgi:DNA-binding NarL/FixJ family response regulator